MTFLKSLESDWSTGFRIIFKGTSVDFKLCHETPMSRCI